jgi:hypothetical protein
MDNLDVLVFASYFCGNVFAVTFFFVEVNGGVVLCAEEGLRRGFRHCAERRDGGRLDESPLFGGFEGDSRRESFRY